MVTASNLPTPEFEDVRVLAKVVEWVQPFEEHTGEHLVLEFTLAGGEKVGFAFAYETADRLMAALSRSQQICAQRRQAVRH